MLFKTIIYITIHKRAKPALTDTMILSSKGVDLNMYRLRTGPRKIERRQGSLENAPMQASFWDAYAATARRNALNT